MGLTENVTLARSSAFCGAFGFMRSRREHEESSRALSSLHAKYEDASQEVGTLSGGNQQKILLARWLVSDKPALLMLNEPTRGIDVGAKADIYRIIVALAEAGVAIMISSSELSELLLLCHVVAVFRDGAPRRSFERGDVSEEKIIRVAIGEGTSEAA